MIEIEIEKDVNIQEVELIQKIVRETIITKENDIFIKKLTLI